MKKDRLRDDRAEIHNLDDLIDARSENPSHMARDSDSLADDVEIPDSLDVNEALTFPHPKHKPDQNPELMGAPYEVDMDEDWDAQDVQPTDYGHAYDEGTDAHLTDDPDELAGEQVHEMGIVDVSEVSGKPAIEIMPPRFEPDEESRA